MRLGILACFAVFTCAAANDVRLIDAIKRRDIKAFDTLMAQHPDVNAALPDGATALSWAVFLDLREPAQKLIAAGAKVNVSGEYGETPLTLALANGDVALTTKLLEAGADPNAKRWNGETALMIAANTGSVDEVRLLLDKGVDVNAAEPSRGQNALMWAAAEGHSDVIDLLIKRGANVKAASKSGFTPLVFGINKNDAKSTQLLLAAGADPNHTLPNGIKVLSVAAAAKSSAAAIALLDGGADIHIADKTGNTPLHVAAQNGSLDLVEKLIAKGADVNARTNPSNEAAPAFGPRGPGGKSTPLLLAARSGHVDVMQALIKAGADPKAKAQDGTTLLLAAASSSMVAAAKYAYQFDKDVMAKDDQDSTVMHNSMGGAAGNRANQDNMVEMIQFLADVGAPMDEVDKRGRTPAKAGDGAPFDKATQRICDIIYSRGGTPKYIPKEYVKPKFLSQAKPASVSPASQNSGTVNPVPMP